MKTSFAFGSVIFLVAAITSVAAVQTSAAATAAQDSTAIRPFTVPIVPQAALDDLRRRIRASRWPEKETVSDATQGVQLATMQKLASYWGKDYDWRKCEAKLKALPNFVTTIDGLDIHFIHVRSKNPNALPMIITHGWPGSIVEQLKIIDPLTNPTAHDGNASDAFDVVIPSLPGYGFSGKPTTTGWDPIRIARAWTVLMKRLGYTRFVAQGGDCGHAVTEQMALQAPHELICRRHNMPLYWLINTAVSSARLYCESNLPVFAPKHVTLPVAVSVYPDEIYAAPRSWTGRAYPKLIHYNRLPKGTHFAAWEQPQSFTE